MEGICLEGLYSLLLIVPCGTLWRCEDSGIGTLGTGVGLGGGTLVSCVGNLGGGMIMGTGDI